MKRITRVLLGVVLGSGIICAAIWILSRTLGNSEPLYASKPLNYWCAQLTNRESAASNRAAAVLANEVIPRLTNQMFCDTNDSKFRTALIEQLNGLPGIHIDFVPCDGRRAQAVNDLTELGTNAQTAIPALVQALRQKDEVLCGPASTALAQIQADPKTVVPILIDCMVDGRGHGRPEVVDALGEYGQKSAGAVPGLIRLLEDHSSKELMVSVPKALKKIDPEAATKAGLK